MTLSPAETCRQVADIIDFESERFAMDHWEHEKGCGTTACIAGHAALLHSDGISENQRFLVSVLSQKYFAPDWRWQDRQGRRLGLDEEASVKMFDPHSNDFWERHNCFEENIRYSKVLRQLSKELEDREEGDLIDLAELEQIAEEALS